MPASSNFAVSVLRRLVASLVIGGLFGWALSRRLPDGWALAAGLFGAAFTFTGFFVNDRYEARERLRRAEAPKA